MSGGDRVGQGLAVQKLVSQKRAVLSTQGCRFTIGGCRATMPSILAAAAFAVLATVAGPAMAQDSKKNPSPVGGEFKTKVESAPAVSGITLDAKQVEAVKLVTGYFNDLKNLKGNFVQTSPDKKERGKFFVKRPGRLRFDYNLPSKQLIVSDGEYVAIQDLDLGTDDRILLEQTPFRLLLRKDVDLIRDARILDVQEADDLIIVTMQDKSPDAPGRIKLFMSRAPQLELKEWVTSDSQGKDTRVEVSNLVKSEEIDPGLFKVIAPTLRKNGQ